MAEAPPVADHCLDACGLSCPLPLLKTKQALAVLESGQILELWATDSGALRDIPAFARLGGHELLHEAHTDVLYKFWLRKSRA